MGILPRTTRAMLLLSAVALAAVVGCQSVPASCVRPNLCDAPRSSLEPIGFTRLEQPAPQVYLLGPGDILGVFIEGILGDKETPPPVHFFDDANIPPALGYPVPVRRDGTLPLPLVPPVQVAGLSLEQAEQVIRKTYTVDRQILQPDRQRIIVTLMKRRTYHVLVVREDTTASVPDPKGSLLGTTQRGACHSLKLAAYENDVLHALAASGGLPGLDAENAVVVLRGNGNADPGAQDLFYRLPPVPAANRLPMAESGPAMPEIIGTPQGLPLGSFNNATRIPLRTPGGMLPPELTPEDVILYDGDVVFVESRDAEVFYTGGLLKGGQHRIPRDYDLDVLGAIAVAGGSIAGPPEAAGGVFRFGSLGPVVPPSCVKIVRIVNGRQFTIKARIHDLMKNPAERVLIQPNDLVTLNYTPTEFVMNAALSMLQFNYFVNR